MTPQSAPANSATNTVDSTSPTTLAVSGSQPSEATDSPRAGHRHTRADIWRYLASVRGAIITGAVLAAAVFFLVIVFLGPRNYLFDLKIYYNAVHFWASGHDLYGYSQPDATNLHLGFTYPPLAAVLMIPMTGLPFTAVSVLSVLGIFGTAVWCSWVCIRERFDIPHHRLPLVMCLAVGAVFVLEPLRSTLAFGQVNLYLMVLIVLDLLILDRRGSRWAGVGIGLAAAIKLTPGIFLLYFILGRRWRPVLRATITGVCATGFAAIVMPMETWRYYTSLIFDSERVGFLYAKANQSVQGLLVRLAVPGEVSKVLVVLAVLAAGIPVVLRIRRALAHGDRLAAMTLTGLLGILVSPASWTHHVVWVVPVCVILVAAAMNSARRPTLVYLLGAATALLMIFDPRILFLLPETYFTSATLFQRVVASLPLFWVLLTALALPISTVKQEQPHSPAATAQPTG